MLGVDRPVHEAFEERDVKVLVARFFRDDVRAKLARVSADCDMGTMAASVVGRHDVQRASDVGLGRLRRLVDEKVTKMRLGERRRVVGVNGSADVDFEGGKVVIGDSRSQKDGSVEDGGTDDALGEKSRHARHGEAIVFDVAEGEQFAAYFGEGATRRVESEEIFGHQRAKSHRQGVRRRIRGAADQDVRVGMA